MKRLRSMCGKILKKNPLEMHAEMSEITIITSNHHMFRSLSKIVGDCFWYLGYFLLGSCAPTEKIPWPKATTSNFTQ